MTLILAQAVNLFSQMIVLMVVINVILSYFLDPYHPIRTFLAQLVEPLLAPIRRIVPLVGMFDFSPLVLIILVQLIARMLVYLLLMVR